VEAHLEVKSSFKVEKMPVVEARLNPSEKANIVLTAHYCHVGPGSDDNASGSAGLIRVAERLVKNRQETSELSSYGFPNTTAQCSG